MRIAQVTLNGHFNYGNILQKFALHHTLKKFTDSTEVLWFSPRSFFPEAGGKPGGGWVKREERYDWEKKFYLREAVRQSKFKDFENLHITTRFDFPYMEDIADEYDFFVIGSDQVWNQKYGKIFLNFVPREKKIAYAASIGANTILDELKELYQRGISSFNYISVREENAIKLIKDLTGRTALFMPDPVLLLTEKEWLDVAQKPTWFKEKYSRGFVLTYYLNRLPPPVVQNFAGKIGLPVINLLDTENYNHFTVGPAEFVWLFTNASLIFTNSFHGMVFSTLFKHPFVVNTLRNKNDSRLISFLKLFGLEDRFDPAEPLKIDFTRRDEVLPLERAKAFKFLSEALLGGDAK